MRTLRLGISGNDVKKWQQFLRGINSSSHIIVNCRFDEQTKLETQAFQASHGLKPDGEPGDKTFGQAMLVGLNVVKDDRVDNTGPNWPPVPNFQALSSSDRVKLFGKFKYIASPTDDSPESIKITDNWASENIISVNIPQLSHLNHSHVQFHKLCSGQLQAFFEELETNNLLDKIITWNGSWVPRFKRGSRIDLSNHSWGTAFDINVKWNMLGQIPALMDKEGCVREIVEIANKHGFYWGGHFISRKDGMHFEIAKII